MINLMSTNRICALIPLVLARPFDIEKQCVAMDCEMVGVGRDGRYSALARASIVDYRGETLYDKVLCCTQISVFSISFQCFAAAKISNDFPVLGFPLCVHDHLRVLSFEKYVIENSFSGSVWSGTICPFVLHERVIFLATSLLNSIAVFHTMKF